MRVIKERNSLLKNLKLNKKSLFFTQKEVIPVASHLNLLQQKAVVAAKKESLEESLPRAFDEFLKKTKGCNFILTLDYGSITQDYDHPVKVFSKPKTRRQELPDESQALVTLEGSLRLIPSSLPIEAWGSTGKRTKVTAPSLRFVAKKSLNSSDEKKKKKKKKKKVLCVDT
eukprot:Trichotokara_eunicae@DN10619_c0_g1_i1.p1